MNQIQIDHLSFIYDTSIEDLFRDLSFSLFQGWTGIIGVNGIGKTTLLIFYVRSNNDYWNTATISQMQLFPFEPIIRIPV